MTAVYITIDTEYSSDFAVRAALAGSRTTVSPVGLSAPRTG